MDEESENLQEPLVRWITFQLDEETYGVTVRQVREILRLNEIVPVPGAEQFILGITNIRGSLVTVVDGRERFGIQPRSYDDRSRMIVIESGDDAVGVIVDSVSDVIDIPDSSINSNPRLNDDEKSRYIRGVTEFDGKLVIMLDLEQLFHPVMDMAAGF